MMLSDQNASCMMTWNQIQNGYDPKPLIDVNPGLITTVSYSMSA